MKRMRPGRSLAVLLVLGAAAACAYAPAPQQPQQPAPPADTQHANTLHADTLPADKAPRWEFGASAYQYFVPDDRNYVQPTITADRGALHLEARYNYEAQDTGSLWAGYKLAGGEELAWQLTPMLGGVVGEVDGVAPGYKGSLGWRRFELYSEGEYLFATSSASDSFFYNWSELTFTPGGRLRFGIVAQRTRAYQADREVERGLLVGWAGERLQFSAYLFNLDESKPITVFSVAFRF